MLTTATLPTAPVVPQMTSKASATTPVEYAIALSADDKHAVFMTLLRELVALNGENGLLPIEDESGESFGYFVPPKAAAEQVRRAVPAQSEADLERTRKALANLDDTFDIQELLSELDLVDAKRG